MTSTGEGGLPPLLSCSGRGSYLLNSFRQTPKVHDLLDLMEWVGKLLGLLGPELIGKKVSLMIVQRAIIPAKPPRFNKAIIIL